MRHVPQEPILLLREFQQSRAQPFELAPETLQISRAFHFDRFRKPALAQLCDGTVNLANRARDEHGEEQNHDQRAGNQRYSLPGRNLLRPLGTFLDLAEFHLDVRTQRA